MGVDWGALGTCSRLIGVLWGPAGSQLGRSGGLLGRSGSPLGTNWDARVFCWLDRGSILPILAYLAHLGAPSIHAKTKHIHLNPACAPRSAKIRIALVIATC